MLRFSASALPLLLLLLALFGFAADQLGFEPRRGAAWSGLSELPPVAILGSWLLEALGLLALFLVVHGRFRPWWIDGVVAGWVAWIFRGPLLVVTLVAATRLPQGPWWTLAFGWWVLYTLCGLALALLARVAWRR